MTIASFMRKNFHQTGDPGIFFRRARASGRLLLIWYFVAAACPVVVRAETIRWFSDPGRTNLASTGEPMDGGFRFELGVFAGGFVPTEENVAQWAAHWSAVRRTDYNAQTKLYDSQVTVVSNAAPFTVGAKAYVWGFRGGPEAGEWILFRATSWTWPASNPFNPLGPEWNVADAGEVILGEVDADGSPFLMKSAAVVQALPPATSWGQWQASELAGESRNGPEDDPDGDGVKNVLEYVFGTDPRNPDTLPKPVVSIFEAGEGRHLAITIPRRKDRPSASLVVEVSEDLDIWHAGDEFTVVVLDEIGGLQVRALIPISPEQPRLFMRVKGVLAHP